MIAVLEHDADKEKEFARRKAITPSIFVYHGTGADCIYSLQRNGLRNLSNSQMMTAGAAYGQGIYISNNLGMATAYSK